MFDNLQEIRRSLCDFGLSEDFASLIADTAKPALWLRPEPNQTKCPTGSTRLGGVPELPDHLEWPWREPYPDLPRRAPYNPNWEIMSKVGDWDAGAHMKKMHKHQLERCSIRRPLSFIAQLDLSSLNRDFAIDRDIPDSGRLLLFYDMEEQPWGYAPEDAIGLRLIWDDSPKASLAPRQAPPELLQTELEDQSVLDACPLQAASTVVPMLPHLYALEQLPGYDDERGLYYDWFTDVQDGSGDGFASPTLGNRFGGWPSPVQGDMQTECQLVSNGLYLGDGSYSETVAKQLEPGSIDWVFLVQIASDIENGAHVGGRRSYLRVDSSRRPQSEKFEKARLILQCY